MKKVILALLLAGSAAYAQAQIQIGPKAGVNFATMDLGEREDKAAEGVGTTVGATFGVAANIKMISFLSFAPELSFSQKGYRYSHEGERPILGENQSFSDTETFKAHYLDMPLLLRGTFGTTVKGYVNAGPSLSYWLNGRYKGYGNTNTTEYSYDLRIKFVDEYKDIRTEEFIEVSKEHARRFELGAALGGGIILPLGGSDLLIDARYTHAFKDIYKEMPETEKARNRVFSVSVMYLFGQ